jgi:hypothetical protein
MRYRTTARRARRHGITGSGIDLQPSLIAWAQRTHPRLRLSVGDLRTTRLGTTFDVVTCVGNTLSYLHTETELTAAFDTIRAHSHPGTLLALATLTGTGQNAQSDSEITTSLGAATVTTTSEWEPDTQIQTTTRTWRFATGRTERDNIRRRYWSAGLLTKLAHAARFHVLPKPQRPLPSARSDSSSPRPQPGVPADPEIEARAAMAARPAATEWANPERSPDPTARTAESRSRRAVAWTAT